MKHISKITLAGTIMLCSSLGSAHGGSVVAAIAETPPAVSPWAFRIEPYGWLTGIEGTTGVGPLVADVDQSFSDIIDNLEMAAALQFEARNGRWGIIADGFYTELGGSGLTPGPIYDSVDLQMKQFLGELTAAYRIYEWPTGSVDFYAGIRYTNLSMDFTGILDQAGIKALSANASQHLVSGIEEAAVSIVEPKVNTFKTGTAAARAMIEAEVTNSIEAEAENRVKLDLERKLLQIRRDNGLGTRDIAADPINREIKAERMELAASTAQLAVAKLRASVDATLQGEVAKAEARVNKAEQDLAAAINSQLSKRLPSSASKKKDWVDPIVGVRGEWNFHQKWFFAAKSDIGGFGVGSDIAWSLQGTVGYRFTRNLSAELGYRYLYTDYSDGAFTYDIDQSGIYTGLNFHF